jgi:hypothetical protein
MAPSRVTRERAVAVRAKLLVVQVSGSGGRRAVEIARSRNRLLAREGVMGSGLSEPPRMLVFGQNRVG